MSFAVGWCVHHLPHQNPNQKVRTKRDTQQTNYYDSTSALLPLTITALIRPRRHQQQPSEPATGAGHVHVTLRAWPPAARDSAGGNRKKHQDPPAGRRVGGPSGGLGDPTATSAEPPGTAPLIVSSGGPPNLRSRALCFPLRARDAAALSPSGATAGESCPPAYWHGLTITHFGSLFSTLRSWCFAHSSTAPATPAQPG